MEEHVGTISATLTASRRRPEPWRVNAFITGGPAGVPAGGASWISYSDMMAALLLIFVLILTYSLYQYFTMLETKTKELDTENKELEEQQKIALNLAKDELDARNRP